MASSVTPYRRGVNFFDSFRREMEDLFDRFGGEDETNGATMTAWAPRVDVEETDKEFVVKADLPGVDVKDVDIQGQDNVLTLRGGREERKKKIRRTFTELSDSAANFTGRSPYPAERIRKE